MPEPVPFPQCRDCVLGLAKAAAELAAPDDPGRRRRALAAGRLALEQAEAPGMTSPLLANRVLAAVRRASGVDDPYAEFKRREMARARELTGRLGAGAGRGLRPALELAALGNSLDFFKDPDQTLAELEELAGAGLAFYQDDTDRLERAAAGGIGTLVYLTDNAGEIYFDLPLFRELAGRSSRAVLAVKGGPAANDLTRAELRAPGLAGRFERVEDTGCDGVGVDWERASPRFKALLGSAGLVLAKGMANFLTLRGRPLPAPLFFVFKLKCAPMVQDLDAPADSYWALWRPAGATI